MTFLLRKTPRYLFNIATRSISGPNDSAASSSSLSILDTSIDELDWDRAMAELSKTRPLPRVDVPRLQARLAAANPLSSLVPIVNYSQALKKLVDLGVDISRWEEIGHLGTALSLLSFEKDVQPWLEFFHHRGINRNSWAEILTRYPEFLKTDLDHLETRVELLRSKNFDDKEIKTLLNNDPCWLLFNVENMDRRLTYFQKNMNLSVEQVKKVCVNYPQLITWEGLETQLKINVFTTHEIMGFTKEETKRLLLKCPEIFHQNDETRIDKQFKFLHNEVGYNHDLLLKFPEALIQDVHETKARYEFIKLLKRDVICPTKPNYISPRALACGSDSEFCEKVAKTEEQFYNQFLRTR